MKKLKNLFESNQKWVEQKLKQDPQTFANWSNSQRPKYLWIGCSDSRLPANEILGLEPGELFVHRNIANLFPHTDFNCLSVLQYAVDYLEIEHVIVCGHYDCGGVKAAMEKAQFGLIDNWLRFIRDVHSAEKKTLEKIIDPKDKYKKLVELNTIHQVLNVCHTTIVQNAWAKKAPLSVHGWVYDVSSGFLKDLNCCISSIDQIDDIYQSHDIHIP